MLNLSEIEGRRIIALQPGLTGQQQRYEMVTADIPALIDELRALRSALLRYGDHAW